MDWNLFWTILLQVAIYSISFTILAIPVGFGISHIVYGFVRPLPVKPGYHSIFRGANNDDD